MSLEQTWRWFGPKDPITLQHIRQTGASGIVTALHHIPVGEIWTVEEIARRKQEISTEGLHWSVAESLPVHEDIKTRKRNHRKYIDTYKESIRNLGRCGVDIVCYNFMPVLDWSRTDLHVTLPDGSITTKFETKVFAAFDLFSLRRKGSEEEYGENTTREAKQYFESLGQSQKESLTQTVLLGLPGSDEAYTLEKFRSALEDYKDVREGGLRENLRLFLREIIPVAEEAGVLMAIHPDDPPRPLLGLPRIVSNENDITELLGTVDSIANGLTFCTGSFGAGPANEPTRMAERFARRINFVHLRNVRKNDRGDFVETDHLDGDVDMFSVMKTVVLEQRRRVSSGRKDARMPFRPDHGHLMLADRGFGTVYPGYSLFGRLRGLAELRGLELGVRESLGKTA